ncbi:MAG: MBL fold metallo-hydrolase [Bacteroidetes bacterium]|nr:MAG: MBL fold metallo-hydrolase [Bacteroidota bacterium]
MQIIPLSEGSFTVDKTKLFVPFNRELDELQDRSKGSLLVEIQPFAVVTSEDIIVLDTGLGFEIDGQLQIHRNLIKAGIDPGKVTKVMLSHLHKDHAGGITHVHAVSGMAEACFPNATYYIQKQELDFAFEKGFPSYITDELSGIKDLKKLVLLQGNGVVDGYIKYELTGAHCPYHQVFWIVDAGETVFFGGDVAPQWQQMKNKFIAKYDYDGKKCMELRQKWWKEGEKDHWTLLFYHDIKTPMYKW